MQIVMHETNQSSEERNNGNILLEALMFNVLYKYSYFKCMFNNTFNIHLIMLMY